MKSLKPFRSLRTKLWVSFAAVIILAMSMAGTAFAWIARDNNTELAVARLSDLAVPLTSQVSVLERLGASQRVISLFLQDQASALGVRVLLLDSAGKVLEDSQGEMQGRQVDLQSPSGELSQGRTVVYSGAIRSPGRPDMYYVGNRAANMRAPAVEALLARAPSSIVVLAVPEQSLGEAWLTLLPGFSVAAVAALVISLAVATLLARSIARPVLAVARASEQMAQGRYDHEVPVKGNDEVSQLARSFNSMARQVKSTHQTLRDFMANASHELKTPLTSIQGFSQAMVDGAIKETEDYQQAGEIINSEAERMRDLVDDLLLLSGMEGGQLRLDMEALDIGQTLLTCSERFRWRADKQEVQIKLEVSPDLPAVEGDSRRLEQAVGNLLDNALRYEPKGGTIAIGAARSEAALPSSSGSSLAFLAEGEAGHVRVWVHNGGSVIPADDLPKIFDRFYRGGGTANRSGDGTGLGLSIVREIVQAHGGAVRAASQPDTGTVFEFNLPVVGRSHS